jgi:hypothetical protein
MFDRTHIWSDVYAYILCLVQRLSVYQSETVLIYCLSKHKTVTQPTWRM